MSFAVLHNDRAGIREMSTCTAGILGTRPRRCPRRQTGTRKGAGAGRQADDIAPKLRQVTILAREGLTTLPRFVASLSRRAAKRPFLAVGLNVAEGWEAAIRSSRPNDASAPFRTFSLQHCTVRLRHPCNRQRGGPNIRAKFEIEGVIISRPQGARKIQAQARSGRDAPCRLIAQEKTSAASCFTREERQWLAVRLMQSAHY